MRRIGTMIVLTVLLGAASGCGTLANINGREHVMLIGTTEWAPARPTIPFGGVANDVTYLKKSENPSQVIAGLADMPLSVVGDVVTLPWATCQWLNPAPNVDAEWRRFWLGESPPQIDPAAPK